MTRTDSANDPMKVDDRMVRIIGIPFFGLVIPTATGLLVLNAFNWSTIGALFYFILMAGLIWEGNRWLLFRFYPVVLDTRSLFQKYVLMIGLNILYTSPISVGMLYLWDGITLHANLTREVLLVTVAVIVVCVIFVTNVYEKVLFSRHNELEQKKMDQLERAKIEVELEVLKNQIDPHFMFNSLNSLSYLIENDSKRAQEFVENLAEVYRYILRNKDRNLVLLRDEMTFMSSYAALMKLRHEQGFQLIIKEPFDEDYLIPPVSLMVALENAVKHNEVSSNNPLVVEVEQGDETIEVRNPISLRRNIKGSTKIGLINLRERFVKTLSRDIHIYQDNGYFIVQMPLLKIEQG